MDIDFYKERLLVRQTELTQLLAECQEDSKPVTLDQQSVGRLSRMDAMQVQAMAQETKQRRQAELQRIGHALVRMEGGEYGYCQGCGEEIDSKRLEVDPCAMQCIKCARQ